MSISRLPGNLALCIAFFTRIPLPAPMGNRIRHDTKLADAVVLFPVAGLLIGTLSAIVWYVANLMLPASIAAGLAIAAGLMVTGALHEDGFADCADGLGATPDREKALEIMRDSTIGSYGGLALILSIGLRWAALAALPPMLGGLALLIAHSGGRTAMTFAMRFSQYARTDGLGKQASGELPTGGFETALIISIATALLLGWISGITSLCLGFAAAWLFLKYLDRRLGGYTGDGLGAMEQIAEITILIALAGFWT